MPSFNKTYKIAGVRSWFSIFAKGQVPITCEAKVDGIGLALRFKNNKIVSAVTRGDGCTGEDVTHNLEYIYDLPDDFDEDYVDFADVEVRGEVYISLCDLDPLCGTPRDYVREIMTQTKCSSAYKGKLQFIAYDLITEDDSDFMQRSEKIRLLSCLGFQTLMPKVVESMDEMRSFYKKLCSGKLPGTADYPIDGALDYPIDGAIYKIDDLEFCEMMDSGNPAGSYPRWAIVYELPNNKEITTVTDVSYHVNREGTLIPIVALTPVVLGGNLVRRAALDNIDDINNLQLKIGSQVLMEGALSGPPKVLKVLLGRVSGMPEVLGAQIEPSASETSMETPIETPETCPACNGELIYEAPTLRCTNKYKCSAQNLQKIIHFVDEDCLDINGLGPKLSESLYRAGAITDVLSIFSLERRYKAGLVDLSGFSSDKPKTLKKLFAGLIGKPKTLNKLFAGIEEARTTTMMRLLYALDIDYLGRENSRLLSAGFKMGELIEEASEGELAAVNGIGQKAAASAFVYFRQNNAWLKDLMNELEIF